MKRRGGIRRGPPVAVDSCQIDAGVAADIIDTPMEITGLPGAVVDMGLGPTHTCAPLDTYRAVRWGANGSGQLGVGDTDPRSGVAFVTGLP